MNKLEYKPYTAKRWTDIPVPEVIGYSKTSESERKQCERDFTQILRANGVIQPDEIISDSKVKKIL